MTNKTKIRIGVWALIGIGIFAGVWGSTYKTLHSSNKELFPELEDAITTKKLTKDVNCTSVEIRDGVWAVADDWNEYFWSAEIEQEVPAEFPATRTVYVSYDKDKSIYKYYEKFESEWYSEDTLPKSIVATDEINKVENISANDTEQAILSMTREECLNEYATRYKEYVRHQRNLTLYWAYGIYLAAMFWVNGIRAILKYEDSLPDPKSTKVHKHKRGGKRK